jgi:hypothetical protein
MELIQRFGPHTLQQPQIPFPAEVEMILSALEAGGHSRMERRAIRRIPYHALANLRLFSDFDSGATCTLYTRDVNHRGLAFVTPHRLPLGHGGVLEVAAPDGHWLTIACTLLRCREAAPGWYEGSVYFNRDQPDFAVLE